MRRPSNQSLQISQVHPCLQQTKYDHSSGLVTDFIVKLLISLVFFYIRNTNQILISILYTKNIIELQNIFISISKHKQISLIRFFSYSINQTF